MMMFFGFVSLSLSTTLPVTFPRSLLLLLLLDYILYTTSTLQLFMYLTNYMVVLVGYIFLFVGFSQGDNRK